MARFLFDCEDEICLPAAYRLVDEIRPFIDKIKNIDVDENEVKGDRKAVFKKILENIMVKYPADTGKMFAKLWVLDEVDVPCLDDNGNPILDEDGNALVKRTTEKAPNAFKTMAVMFSNEVAIDFFTSVLPSLLHLSRGVLPLLNQ